LSLPQRSFPAAPPRQLTPRDSLLRQRIYEHEHEHEHGD
jgi:hypothetical protein